MEYREFTLRNFTLYVVMDGKNKTRICYMKAHANVGKWLSQGKSINTNCLCHSSEFRRQLIIYWLLEFGCSDTDTLSSLTSDKDVSTLSKLGIIHSQAVFVRQKLGGRANSKYFWTLNISKTQALVFLEDSGLDFERSYSVVQTPPDRDLMHDLYIQKIAIFFFGNFGLTHGMRMFGTQSMKNKLLRLNAFNQLGVKPNFYTKTKKNPIGGEVGYPFVPDMIFCFPDNEAIFIEYERSPRNIHDCNIIQSKLWALDASGHRLWTLGNITLDLYKLLDSHDSSVAHFHSDLIFNVEKTDVAIALADKMRTYSDDVNYEQYDLEDLDCSLIRGILSLGQENPFWRVATRNESHQESGLAEYGLTSILMPEHAKNIRLTVGLQ